MMPKTEVQLWGIDEQGNRVLVIDRGFVAYFYAMLTGNFEAVGCCGKNQGNGLARQL